MGAYCLRALMPSHTASVGEIMQVLWSDYYGAVIFGDRREIACIPHKGCRLEIVATAKTTHPLVNLLLPGHVIRYKRAFFFRDRFELPSSATVGLDELVGFKLQLAPSAAPMRPAEELILELATARSGARRSARHLRARFPEPTLSLAGVSLCCGYTAVQLLSSVGETWS